MRILLLLGNDDDRKTECCSILLINVNSLQICDLLWLKNTV